MIECTLEVIEGSESSSVNTVYIKEKDMTEPKSNNEAIKFIHSLANTLIKSDYKWQCGEVTPKTIELALKGVENIEDDYDRMHLRNSLTKWKKGDFSNAVKVHNYVWEMLGGNIGKAEGKGTQRSTMGYSHFLRPAKGESIGVQWEEH